MSKNIVFLTIGGLFISSLLALPTNAASSDCNAPQPGSKDKGAVLSKKLSKCGSVLKPSQAADPDIVVVPPPIDDPLAIHPKSIDPEQQKLKPKGL